jgi:hypothetical protein
MMRWAICTLLLAQAAKPVRSVEFGEGTLTVPEGCTHVEGRGIDSAVGHLECGKPVSKIKYDIGFASPGAKPEIHGWCTANTDRPPARRTELRTPDGRTVFVCDLPAYYEDPAKLVAVPAPTVSFYVDVRTPSDATWLLQVALAFQPSVPAKGAR